MATYTSNYAWTKPGGNDQVDISVLNGNLDSQDAIMHKAFGNMAQAFSQLSAYAVGDIVLYDNDLYKCHTAVTVAGVWTGSTNWTSWTLAEGGGGGGTSDYPDLTNKPSINGVTLSGNKTTSDLGIDKTAVGLGNVPNVSTNDQTPTFTEASTRNNIASGEKLSVILGKIQKFFNDLKTVAFSGSFSDLSDKPNATQVMLSDGVTSIEDALDGAMPRTTTGTTATTLATAYSKLSTEQKRLCKIQVVDSNNIGGLLSYIYSGEYENMYFDGNTIKSIQLTIGSSSASFAQITYTLGNNARSSATLTIASWTLYYQGAEIS